MLYDDEILIKAVQDSNLRLIKKILKLDFSLVLGNFDRLLCCVFKQDNFKVTSLLMDHFSNCHDLESGLKYKKNLLHFAIKFGSIKMIECLIKNGCNINDSDIYGHTSLHSIIWSERDDIKEELIKLLLSHGALVNVRDRWGNTPFHLAVWKGDYKSVSTLFARGVDLSIEDNWGNTPLHIASKIGNESILEFIVLQNKKSSFETEKKVVKKLSIGRSKRMINSFFSLDEYNSFGDLQDERMSCGCCVLFF